MRRGGQSERGAAVARPLPGAEASAAARVWFQVLRDILKEVQSNMVPRSMLREWALHTFPNATDYWTFRKMLTIQLALIGFAEFVLHLNRLNPEMLQIAQVSRGARPAPLPPARSLLERLPLTSRTPANSTWPTSDST